jgi:hypothetical protein
LPLDRKCERSRHHQCSQHRRKLRSEGRQPVMPALRWPSLTLSVLSHIQRNETAVRLRRVPTGTPAESFPASILPTPAQPAVGGSSAGYAGPGAG